MQNDPSFRFVCFFENRRDKYCKFFIIPFSRYLFFPISTRIENIKESEEAPAEHNTITSGANASAVRRHDYIGNDFVFLLF